jgi:hypothetical protein
MMYSWHWLEEEKSFGQRKDWLFMDFEILLADRDRIVSSPSQQSWEGRQSSLQRDCRGGLVAADRRSNDAVLPSPATLSRADAPQTSETVDLIV